MNRMRLKIASRLKEAQNTNAMLTTFNEIDMRYVCNWVYNDSEIESINIEYKADSRNDVKVQAPR